MNIIKKYKLHILIISVLILIFGASYFINAQDNPKCSQFYYSTSKNSTEDFTRFTQDEYKINPDISGEQLATEYYKKIKAIDCRKKNNLFKSDAKDGLQLCPNFYEKAVNDPAYNQDSSHDGKLVAEIKDTKLVIKHLDNGNVIRTVSESESSDPYKNLTGFSKPRFSLDDSKVYFMSYAWTTSPAIHELNLATGKTRFITDGYGLIVIPQGKYAGDLIADRHQYFNGTGSYDWFWIINPKTGKVIDDPIGDSLGDFFDILVCPRQ